MRNFVPVRTRYGLVSSSRPAAATTARPRGKRISWSGRRSGAPSAAQRDVGVALHGDLGQRFDYDVGLFAGDNNGSSRRSGLTGAGRLEWEPGPDLVLAVYGSEGRLAAVDTDPENGLEGRLSSGYRFFENVYVQGRRTRLGGDVEWSPGRWQFTVEALRVRDERQEQGVDIDDLPSVVGTGASLTTRWRFAPRRDVAVRYEYLGFDDDGPDTDMASVRPRAADLRARAAQAVTFGGSWGVTRWVRLMGNAGVEWFSDPRTAPEAGRDRGLLDARHASAGRTSRHPGIARPVSAVTGPPRPVDLDLLRGFDIARPRSSRRARFNSGSIASICSRLTDVVEPLLARLAAEHSACCVQASKCWARYESIYLDTPDRALYHAHRCGRRPRYKVRIRHHVDRQLSLSGDQEQDQQRPHGETPSRAALRSRRSGSGERTVHRHACAARWHASDRRASRFRFSDSRWSAAAINERLTFDRE